MHLKILNFSETFVWQAIQLLKLFLGNTLFGGGCLKKRLNGTRAIGGSAIATGDHANLFLVLRPRRIQSSAWRRTRRRGQRIRG
jgi:hypothetical protein